MAVDYLSHYYIWNVVKGSVAGHCIPVRNTVRIWKLCIKKLMWKCIIAFLQILFSYGNYIIAIFLWLDSPRPAPNKMNLYLRRPRQLINSPAILLTWAEWRPGHTGTARCGGILTVFEHSKWGEISWSVPFWMTLYNPIKVHQVVDKQWNYEGVMCESVTITASCLAQFSVKTSAGQYLR